MNTVELKEGQTYICKETRMRYWTVGKEYPVVLDSKGKPAIIDNGGDYWYGSVSSMLNDFSTEFELVKYDTTPLIDIDLNTLTLEQLTEYVDLQQAVDLANTELNKFIEKVSK